MKLFINDIPVHILGEVQLYELSHYDIVLEGGEDLKKVQLADDVLIRNASYTQIDQVFKLMKSKKFKKLDGITFLVDEPKAVTDFIKSKFTIIKAAGGLVQKGDKILLIYRLERWDLPKGKLDKKEKEKEAALREVEEECSIKVVLGEKICATWHTYTSNGKGILKKTTWYSMNCYDDSQMNPQREEDIEEVRWMDAREVRQALYNSYRSVRHVFKEFYKMGQKAS